MKRENDEITDLFRSRLGNAEMVVRDGFWEELNSSVVTHHRHHRLVFFRVAAAASVLLVLAASSAAIWYFSPKEEIEDAFTQLAVSGSGKLDGDVAKQEFTSIHAQPVLQKPIPTTFGMLAQRSEEDDDSASVTVSMSFSFSSTSSVNRGRQNTDRGEDLWAVGGGTEHDYTAAPQIDKTLAAEVKRNRKWAMKAAVGTAMPAENATYKMPISVGLTVERHINRHLSVETGLLYSNLRTAAQSLHYLGIPVKMNIALAHTPKLDIYASLGAVADKCIAGAPNNSFGNEPIQLAVTAGVGVNYKISERLALFAEPGISHHFKTDSRLETVRTARPTNFNLICGLRMSY